MQRKLPQDDSDYTTPASDPLNAPRGDANLSTPADQLLQQPRAFADQAQPDAFSYARPKDNKDPLKAFLRDKTFPEHKSLHAEDLPANGESLRLLADADCWKEVLKLADRCINTQAPPHEILQFKLALVIALLQLRYNEPAVVQCDTLGNLEGAQYFYQSFPSHYKNEQGSFVSFTLDMLQAFAPAFKENPNKALDNLYRLLFRVEREIQKHLNQKAILYAPERVNRLRPLGSKGPVTSAPRAKQDSKPKQQTGAADNLGEVTPQEAALLSSVKPVALSIWRQRETRILMLITTAHCIAKEYHLALQIMEKVVAHYSSNKNMLQNEDYLDQLCTLISLTGSIYLQAGLVQEGTKAFKRAEQLYNVDELSDLLPNKANLRNDVLVRLLLNRGYQRFATGQYSAAYEQFNNCVKVDPLNITAANNRSIALLYTCNLTKAVEALEESIRVDPVQMLDESIVLNLTVLYDLESDQSVQKKQLLFLMIQKYKGDNFPMSALKL